jgi:FixJ family two-component response regulator
MIKQLKERESCLSVILLTAFADVPTAVDVMKLGAAGVSVHVEPIPSPESDPD